MTEGKDSIVREASANWPVARCLIAALVTLPLSASCGEGTVDAGASDVATSSSSGASGSSSGTTCPQIPGCTFYNAGFGCNGGCIGSSSSSSSGVVDATSGTADGADASAAGDSGSDGVSEAGDAGTDASADAMGDSGVQCGPKQCAPGLDCCDPSCGLCAQSGVCARIGPCAPVADAQPPIACGSQTCSAGQLCVYLSLGGPPANCMLTDDAGLCPSGSTYVATCPNLGNRPGCVTNTHPQPLSCVDIPSSCDASLQCACFPPGVCADAGAGAAVCALVDRQSLTCATQ
jgi:hypothetical protein